MILISFKIIQLIVDCFLLTGLYYVYTIFKDGEEEKHGK